MSVEFVHKFVSGRLPATILVMHGTGGDENDLLPIARALAPGAALLSPRGKGSEHGAARFFSRKGPGVFDEAEIGERTAELAEWLGEAAGKYGFDPRQLYALGYSNGANMAAATMLLHPGAIAGGLLLRAMVVMRPAPLPQLNGAPVLISAGQHDIVVPPGGANALAKLLTEAGARVDLVLQNADHELTPADFSLGKQWFTNLFAQGMSA